jgi:hypothetical protein
MTPPIIQTPRGAVMVYPDGKARLVWNTNFRAKWQARFSAGQKAVDESVLRDCDPFIALRTGMLIKSGILGTVPGQGVVSWIAPYARKHYYTPRKTTNIRHPQAGPYWFEVAKGLFLRAWRSLYASKMRGAV